MTTELILVIVGFVNAAQLVTPFQDANVQRIGGYPTMQACAEAGNLLKDGLIKQGVASAVVCIPGKDSTPKQ